MSHKNFTPIILMSLIALIIFTAYISFQVSALKRQSRDAYDLVTNLYSEIYKLSDQISELEKKDQLIQNTNYNVTNVEREQTILGNVHFTATLGKMIDNQKISLLYRPYDLFAQEQDNSSKEWLKYPVTVNYNQLESEFRLPYTDDYELQLMLEQNGETLYEPLPNLDLHTKLDHIFSRNINMHTITDKKIDFDAQIVQIQSNLDVNLDSAQCNIYYNDQLQKTYDVIQETKEGTQKKPQSQMEHLDMNYWFINKSYEFEKIQNFKPENVRIELLLTDSIGNTYSTDFNL